MASEVAQQDFGNLRPVIWNSDGLLVVDADGMISLANPAAAGLLGRAVDDLVGADFGRPLVSGVVEIDLRHPNRVQTVEMLAVRTTWNGRPVTVVSLHDVTAYVDEARRLAEGIERHELRLERLAHDLRNPLTGLLGVVGALREHDGSIPAEERDALLGRIGELGGRLERLVDDALRLSDAGVERVVLADLLASRLIELGDGARNVRVTCPPDAIAWADPEHVWEILRHLVDNARKYGAPPVHIEVARHGGRVVVEVVDHGAGVSEAFAPRLFERFARASAGGARTDGFGLGLAIARRLARDVGGDVTYRRSPDGRPTFRLDLPEPTWPQ